MPNQFGYFSCCLCLTLAHFVVCKQMDVHLWLSGTPPVFVILCNHQFFSVRLIIIYCEKSNEFNRIITGGTFWLPQIQKKIIACLTFSFFIFIDDMHTFNTFNQILRICFIFSIYTYKSIYKRKLETRGSSKLWSANSIQSELKMVLKLNYINGKSV